MAGTVSGAYAANLANASADLANRMASFKDVLSQSGVNAFTAARQGLDLTMGPAIQSAVQGASNVGSELIRQNSLRESNMFGLIGKAYELDAVARENEKTRKAELTRGLLTNISGGLGQLGGQSRQLPAAPSALANAQATAQTVNNLTNSIYNNPIFREQLARRVAALEAVNSPSQTGGGVLE